MLCGPHKSFGPFFLEATNVLLLPRIEPLFVGLDVYVCGLLTSPPPLSWPSAVYKSTLKFKTREVKI